MGKTVVAILGGRGMLGTDLAAACQQPGLDARVFDLPDFDITDVEQLRHAVNDADAIVNCAAYTDVDGAETEKALAYRVNAEAVGNLGRFAKAAAKWVLQISTDFVFDGKADRPYVETDAPNPINEYGRSKLAGEEFLRGSGCAHCIMRVEWTYGLNGVNFVTKLIELAKKRTQLKVVDDQIGSPTATTEVAKAICKVLTGKPEGLYHFAGSGYVSRYEVARFILQRLSMNVELLPCTTQDFQSAAERPRNSTFNCDKIQRFLGEPIKPWQGPLEAFLEQL